MEYEFPEFENLISPNAARISEGISIIELREINDKPDYWINNRQLFNAKTCFAKKNISENEAFSVAKKHLIVDLKVSRIQKISETDKHHEYREKLLPVYLNSYEHDETVVAYVSAMDVKFQTPRH